MAKKKRKKTAAIQKRPPGRPRKAAADCMVPMSVSIPVPVRELIDRLCDSTGSGRSAVVGDLIGRGLNSATIKRKLGGKGAGS